MSFVRPCVAFVIDRAQPLRRWLALATLCLFSACITAPPNPVGQWRGWIKNPSGEQIAFTLDVQREGDRLTGAFVNGDERTVSSAGSFDGKTLTLRYDFYDGELTAEIEGDRLRGKFDRQWQKKTLTRELTAERQSSTPVVSTAIPDAAAPINGEWILKVGDVPNQRLWRAAFQHAGGRANNEARGTIIPVSGDWGAMSGTFENGELKLYRFDVINARVFRARLTPQGTLEGIVDLGLFDPTRKVTAERLTESNRASVAALPDPNNYTRMSNPAEPFRFSFPDLNGQTVSFTDERFKNKAVVVSITGSWCPNCHEESPFLQQMYERYKAQGLEVVALAFEYTGDGPRDLEQLKIFGARHKLTYPLLLAGSTEEGETGRKLPQLVNFGAFPTSVFIGRDGLVKHIHAGFEGRATGERFERLKADFEERIKELLGS